ncbi:hypothetical protein T11_14066, partial [Trichinella zimbabwensis]
MEEEMVWRKRHWGKQIVGESRPGTDKIQVVWILWNGNGTEQKKSLLRCSGEIRSGLKKWKRRWWGENGTWRENGGNVVWGKSPRDGQNSGGVDFMERRRHGAERKPPRL